MNDPNYGPWASPGPKVQLETKKTAAEFARRGDTYSGLGDGKLIFDNFYFRLIEEENGFQRLFLFAEQDLADQILDMKSWSEESIRHAAQTTGFCFGLAENVRVNLRPAYRKPHPNAWKGDRNDQI